MAAAPGGFLQRSDRLSKGPTLQNGPLASGTVVVMCQAKDPDVTAATVPGVC